jgi:ABC-2 type transport system permease protein
MKWGEPAMQLRTSWFNKEMVLQDLRTVGWISVIYFLGLLFAIPLQIVMDMTRDDLYYSPHYENLFSYNMEIQLILFAGIPVLLGLFLFRYLQVKQSTDFIHSLPIKKESIFSHHLIVGLVFLLIPVLLVGIILTLFHSFLDMSDFFTMQELAVWVGTTILIDCLLFSAAVFAGMLTGLSAVQAVFTYILLFFPLGMSILFNFNLARLLFGYPGDFYLNNNFERFSPLTHLEQFDRQPISLTFVVIYITAAIVLTVFALFIYKKRKNEAASQTVAFSKLRPVFKYGVTFFTMLFGGSYFGEMQENWYWTLFGYASGTVVGYFISEMVLQKSWRVFGSLKGLLPYSLVVIFVFFLVQFDVTGYEKRLPELGEIERVYFNDRSPWDYINQEESSIPLQYIYKEENIDAILDLHNEIIANKESLEEKNPYWANVFIVYELKNGNKQIRQYNIPTNNGYEEYLKPIYESTEYKKITYNVLNVENRNVDQITISPNGPVDHQAMIASSDKISELMAILKDEVTNASYEGLTNTKGLTSHISIEVSDDDQHVYLELLPTYKKLLDWLEKENLIEDALLTADDIEYAVIAKRSDFRNQSNYPEEVETKINELLDEETAWKINDHEKIEELMQSIDDERGNNGYVITFKYKSGHYLETRDLSKEAAPDFVQKALNE